MAGAEMAEVGKEEGMGLSGFLGTPGKSGGSNPTLMQVVGMHLAFDKGRIKRRWMRIQVVLYACAVLVAVLVVIPVRITTSYFFNGRCLLYAGGTWQNGTFHLEEGRYSACDFSNYVTCIFVIVYGVLIMGFRIKTLKEPRHGHTVKSHKLSMCCATFNVVVNCCIALLMLGVACVLTLGFKRWCDALLQPPHSPFQRCYEAQRNVKFDNIYILSSSFFNSMTLATTSAWICCFIWVLNVIATARYVLLLK